ncbi:MAG: UDP-N-acetylmuramoyl-L-alanyl-D-glutamate--2,6-diaminopimelate ligase [Bacilli bacterium]|jgi:UDP-N-acetylmuramoyl-L-alanyl-D-glutamate--2,6-diaminopimelate ligase|nr:UDP-N-acetylmuramoyl-L-alanyl-D-glutamate--2,6-diaminopimelate ligase [Bacilli bacterium]
MITIKTDSRKVKKGDTFVALKGINSNGDIYIEKAIENGASKIVCEKGSYSVETLNVDNPREYLLKELERMYHSYLEEMTIIGITGTNGKTTSAYLLSELLNRSGNKSAYIGTIGFYIGMERMTLLNNTTPDICDLYELLLDAYEENCQYVVLEVSSQGLSYGRLEGVPFDCAIFTNLTQDHLDYHKTMENYALAKQKLFEYLPRNGLSIINDDDAYKEYYLLPKNHNITYGFDGGDYRILDFNLNLSGTVFRYEYKETISEIKTNLIGKYNIYNLLTALIVLEQLKIKIDRSFLSQLESPGGRMEMVNYHNNLIIIDYAHTPDAMEKIIGTVKEATKGNIYVVFGCTGSRDRLKRPIMAEMATDMCKFAIFTSDDLHEEPFEQIIDDMTKELKNTNYEVCKDRKDAIYKGISKLTENDVLLILGKGHEEVMIIGNEKIPFHDRTIVDNYVSNR